MMNVLYKNSWKNKFLDYALTKEHVRIEVEEWFVLQKVEDQFIVPKKSLKLVYNYIKKIGVKHTITKIISRRNEAIRTDKHLSLGSGSISDPGDTGLPIGAKVIFLATNHPQMVNRVVLHKSFVTLYDTPTAPGKSILFKEIKESQIAAHLTQWKGWNNYSGYSAPYEGELREVLIDTYKALLQDKSEVVEFTNPADPVTEIGGANEPINNKKILISGFGQYTKTTIMPFLPSGFSVSKIFEYDPTQVTEKDLKKFRFDSSYNIRSEDRAEVFVIAGYHHSHVPLALAYLQNNPGGYLLIEKPLATNKKDLIAFESYVKQSGYDKFFVGFHKRYCPFNQLLMKDILTNNEPFSYYCTVFELDLPREHWYNWPNSGSRIISNGCHWVDHFLYLNDYNKVISMNAKKFSNHDMVIEMELQNGSNFCMVLTNQGSPRIGVREHIEIRKRDVTVIIDDKCYKCENKDSIVRKASKHALGAHHKMYKQIFSAIVEDKIGDNIKALYSTDISIQLNDLIESKKG